MKMKMDDEECRLIHEEGTLFLRKNACKFVRRTKNEGKNQNHFC